MLQLDMNYTRDKRPPDFLARNRKAIKSKCVERKLPPARPSKLPPAPRGYRARGGPPSRGERDKEDTVIISKAYLDNLLRRSLAGGRGEEEESTHVGGHGKREESIYVGGRGRREEPTHVTLDRHDVPGLPDVVSHRQEQSTYPSMNESHTSPPHHRHADQQRKTAKINEEAYFPFGRPGCGAPLRTDSGHVIADLRTLVSDSYHQTPSKSSHPSYQQEPSVLTTNKPLPSTQPAPLPSTQPAPDDGYFPFGRPGCGAPLRTDSGHVMADLRTRTSITGGPASLKYTSLSPDVPGQAKERSGLGNTDQLNVSTSPRFARGVGPHVDNYALREREEKRRKHLEHVAYLKAQVEAKQQAKKEEKERKEREEREIEAQLERDRQKLKVEYQREKERVQRKEDEVRKRQALLQKALDTAAQQATTARQKTKHHPSQSRTHVAPPPSLPHSTRSHGLHRNVTFDPRDTRRVPPDHESSPRMNVVMRSPSLPHSGHGGNLLPPSYRSQQRQGHNGTAVSRIPVPNKSHTRDARQGGTRTKGGSGTQGDRTRQQRRRGGGGGGYSPPPRAYSPPPRAPSPPVPTLAKAQRMQRSNDNNRLPHLTTERQPHEGSYRRSPPPSPPGLVPTATLGRYAGNTVVPAPPPGLPPAEGHYKRRRRDVVSPPVPALAKKLRNDGGAVGHAPSPTRGIPSSGSAQPNNLNHLNHVNATPSYHQDATPSSHLPPIVPEEGFAQPHPPLPRQEVILQELAELRKGIMSHRSTIDHSLVSLLHRHGNRIT